MFGSARVFDASFTLNFQSKSQLHNSTKSANGLAILLGFVQEQISEKTHPHKSISFLSLYKKYWRSKTLWMWNDFVNSTNVWTENYRKHFITYMIQLFSCYHKQLDYWHLLFSGAIAHLWSGSANKLLTLRPLVHRQIYQIIQTVSKWCVIRTSSLPAVLGLLDWNYLYKSVATQVPCWPKNSPHQGSNERRILQYPLKAERFKPGENGVLVLIRETFLGRFPTERTCRKV